MLQQDYTQWHLPEGATARLGKGEVNDNSKHPQLYQTRTSHITVNIKKD